VHGRPLLVWCLILSPLLCFILPICRWRSHARSIYSAPN
jgi:hypothetical protein